MPSKNDAFTLEENLALTNKELTSNWAKLASLITAYEGTSWNASRKKAIDLLGTGKAIAYIEGIREEVKKHPDKLAEPPKQQPVVHLPSDELTIYERNYDLLMEIAPELEERLANFKKGCFIYGKSKLTGTRDFNIDFVGQDKDSFYLALSQYSMMNGDLFGDPDMEIRVDLKNRVIEALHYQDQFQYAEVYTDKRERQAVFPIEKKRQNAVLSGWLKKVKKAGHKVVFTDPEDEEPEDTSEIIDHYKKGQRLEEKKSEVKPDKPTKSNSKKDDEPIDKKEEAKIIALHSKNENDHFDGVKSFVSIVAFREIGTKIRNKNDLEERVNYILTNEGISDYLAKAWDDLQEESHVRLKELNFYRLFQIIPEISEKAKFPDETLRLFSEKSKVKFDINLGDTRKDEFVIGIHQIESKENVPTILIKVNSEAKSISIDLLINDFMEMPNFVDADESNVKLESYQASIGFEKWLKFIEKNNYKLRREQESEGNKSFKKENDSVSDLDEDSRKYDNDYINKDIPDFEPGKVQLTETHKKYGVTQKVINEINRTQKGKVIFPRAKAMIHNTKDKKADLAQQAQMPGFRISKTGKFYFEGRSNRADRTRSGY